MTTLRFAKRDEKRFQTIINRAAKTKRDRNLSRQILLSLGFALQVKDMLSKGLTYEIYDPISRRRLVYQTPPLMFVPEKRRKRTKPRT